LIEATNDGIRMGMVIGFLTSGSVGQGSIFSEYPGGTVAEFFKLPVEREDGSKGCSMSILKPSLTLTSRSTPS
jgi:hypothetical protein